MLFSAQDDLHRPTHGFTNLKKSGNSAVAVLRACILSCALGPLALVWLSASPAQEQLDQADRCAAYLAGEAERPAHPPPWGEAREAPDTIVRMTVAGTPYAIPGSYFRHPPVGCGEEEGGFYLMTLMPEEGPSPRPWGSHTHLLVPGKDVMGVLFQVKSQEPGFGGRFADGRTLHWQYLQNVFLTWTDVFDYAEYRDAGDRRSFVARAAQGARPRLGLMHKLDPVGRDVFFALDETSDPTLVMVCNQPKDFPDQVASGRSNYPGCQLWTRYRGGILNLDFRKTYLEAWPETLAAARVMLDGFVEINPSPTEPEN